jgi:hypothetical protein
MVFVYSEFRFETSKFFEIRIKVLKVFCEFRLRLFSARVGCSGCFVSVFSQLCGLGLRRLSWTPARHMFNVRTFFSLRPLRLCALKYLARIGVCGLHTLGLKPSFCSEFYFPFRPYSLFNRSKSLKIPCTVSLVALFATTIKAIFSFLLISV